MQPPVRTLIVVLSVPRDDADFQLSQEQARISYPNIPLRFELQTNDYDNVYSIYSYRIPKPVESVNQQTTISENMKHCLLQGLFFPIFVKI